jgi:hypothetical protein
MGLRHGLLRAVVYRESRSVRQYADSFSLIVFQEIFVRRKLDWELYLLKSNDGNKLSDESHVLHYLI